MTSLRRATAAAAAALAVLVALVYLPIRNHDFVEFDDSLYVTENPRVREGLSADTLRWAFTNDDAYLWHPLTWVSLLIDAERAGVEAAGPFLTTNLALHTLNTLLALWALLALTAPIGGSRAAETSRRAACLLAAGIFALHPVQVEAVAWVSSRKDLLATAFFLLTLVAYAAWARRPGGGRYAAVLALSTLGAMAKTSHAALPLLLLGLDVWPLGRLSEAGVLRWRILEKLPLVAVQLVAVGANLAMNTPAANVWGHDPALPTRVAAAVANLAAILGRLAWPASLTIVYPSALQPIHPLPAWSVVTAAAAGLALVTGIALAAVRRQPAFAVGWLGFVALLLPVLGILPIGLRSPHDRYLMAPLWVLGLGVCLGVRGLVADSPAARRTAVVLGLAVLAACAFQTRRQVDVWRDSGSLFAHAVAVAGDDPLVRYAEGTWRAKRGDLVGARVAFERALARHPDHAGAHHNLGLLLRHDGDVAGARAHLERAVALRPDWERALLHLGLAREADGHLDGALASYARAVETSDSADAHAALGMALLSAGRFAEGEDALRAALARDPDHRDARGAVDWLERARAQPGGPG